MDGWMDLLSMHPIILRHLSCLLQHQVSTLTGVYTKCIKGTYQTAPKQNDLCGHMVSNKGTKGFEQNTPSPYITSPW